VTSQRAIRVLIAEDEEHLGTILEHFLRGRGCLVTKRRDGRSALEAIREEAFDVALLDIVMPEVDGLEVLRQMQTDPAPPEVIVISGHGTVDTAIGAIKLGAFDYVSKPYRMAEIDILVRRAAEKRMLGQENALLHASIRRGCPDGMVVSETSPMQVVVEDIARLAAEDSPVLLVGERGSGRTLAGRQLHRQSRRTFGPAAVIDGRSASSLGLDADLFGLQPADGKSADTMIPGAAELAGPGTLVIQEVGSLSRELQGRLFRAIESGGFTRSGGRQRIPLRARVVGTTSEDLETLAKTGHFHPDLYARLASGMIRLPPLRERPMDIALLMRHFLSRTPGALRPHLASDVLPALERYPWPGNVGELEEVVRHLIIAGNDSVIHAADLPLLGGVASARGNPLTLADLERQHIESVLVQTSWHQGQAAAALGISSKTLYRKIKEYGFERH
jgi:two-component system, NtrC family, response regulator AtoC